jgi:hypothetical protein
MNDTRRDFLTKALFGSGSLGLRALATGLPAWFLARPLIAQAQQMDTAATNKLQYLVLSTSSSGDPVNANVPGSYEFPDIVHPAGPAFAATPINLGGKMVQGAQIWSTLPAPLLAKTSFFHHATLTNNHGNLNKVLKLMGATTGEIVPSIYAKALSPMLHTLQPEPISIGAGSITYAGRAIPSLKPLAVKDQLSAAPGALQRLEKLRDQTLDEVHKLLKADGTTAQRKYLDEMAQSRTQSRSLAGNLAGALMAITSDDAKGQVAAAAALIKMNVSPVVTIKLSFGGDNHGDRGLAKETKDTTAGVGAITELFARLQDLGLQDRVTFAMLNVFGRTLKKSGTSGRDHWASHHATVMIGNNINAGVVGGVTPQAGDYYATPIDSATGAKGQAGADIPFDQTSPAMAKTLGVALGLPIASLDTQITGGKVVTAAVKM